MGKGSGMGDQFWFGGYDLGADTNSINRIGGGPTNPLNMTDITQGAMARQGGERDGGMDIVSYWDVAPGAAHAAYSPLPTTDVVCTYARGTTLGNPSAHVVAKQVGYDPNRGQAGDLLFTVNLQANGYGLVWAFQATAGKRTDAAATGAASVSPLDQLTTTPGAFGGLLCVQLFSLGSGSVTIKAQDSPDNITYTDITGATTTALAAAPAAAFIVTGAININRYVKIVTTGTFTNAVFAASFYRHRTVTVY